MRGRFPPLPHCIQGLRRQILHAVLREEFHGVEDENDCAKMLPSSNHPRAIYAACTVHYSVLHTNSSLSSKVLAASRAIARNRGMLRASSGGQVRITWT